MKRHLGILMRGVVTLVPAAITVWVLLWVGGTFQSWAESAIGLFWKAGTTVPPGAGVPPPGPPALPPRTGVLPPGTGVLMILVAVYFVGLLMHLWVFQRVWGWMESLLSRVPGVKIIFESVRDLMKLFGGGAASMGRTVEYRPPGTGLSVLGIVTNENPPGAREGEPKRVAVYIPLAYMFGGPTVLARPEDLRELDIPVEHALKLAATALVGGPVSAAPAATAKAEQKKA